MAAEVAAVRFGLPTDLLNALGAYGSAQLDQAAWPEAYAWLERLAARWRELGEVEHLADLEEEWLPEEGVQLFSALEDSLILTLSSSAPRRALTLDVDEIAARIYLAGQDGSLGEDWRAMAEEVMEAYDERAGKRVERPELPRHAMPRLPSVKRRRQQARTAELMELTSEALVAAIRIYEELHPDGRELTEAEREAADDRVEALAEADRLTDRVRFLFSETDWKLFALLLAAARSARRGLILACSANSEHRALAMPVDELQGRVLVANERIQGRSLAEIHEHAEEIAERYRGSP